jgi:ribosomal protein L29
MANKIVKATKAAKVIMTVAEMRVSLLAKQNDLIEAKRGLKLGELTNPRAITALRKEIARLHTAIRADELTAKEIK